MLLTMDVGHHTYGPHPLTLPLNVVAAGREMTYAGLVEGGFCRIIFPSLQLARGHVRTQYRERKEVLHKLATGPDANF